MGMKINAFQVPMGLLRVMKHLSAEELRDCLIACRYRDYYKFMSILECNPYAKSDAERLGYQLETDNPNDWLGRPQNPYPSRRTESDRERDRVTKNMRKSVLNRDKRCLCCGSTESLCIDHVVSIANGGKSKISNLQTLCRSCNSKKGTETIDYRSNSDE